MDNQILNFLTGIFLILKAIIYSIISPLFPRGYFHKSVRNQIVLVTGGGSGFGQLLAKKFALDQGSTVVVWDVNKNGMEATTKMVKAGGGKCFSYVVDVSSREEIYAAAKKVEAEVGKVDILINNAGIADETYLVDMPEDRIEKMFKVNLLAHFWTTKAFLPAMISKKQGHIVTVSSAAGLFGVPGLATYCATKFGAVGFHDSLSKEIMVAYPDAKIETTVICPYFVRTPMVIGKEHLLPPPSKFLPIREPEPVVDDMVDAILSNQNMLIPSWGIRVLLFIKSNVPSRVLTQIGQIVVRMPKMKELAKKHKNKGN